MVNRNSASASEIVSGAMQDHDRAILVGETTFGKALVQGVYNIAEGAGLALTTGRYFTPSGRMIQRPWDGAFDEYLTYSYRDQTADRPHDPAQLKYTDGGRKVYSGGGIEPDHFVAGPVEGFNPSRFSRMLRDRGAFVGFAERFTKDGDKRPAAKSAATHTVAPGWQVTDAMVAEFRDFVIAERVRFDEAAFKADVAFIKAMIALRGRRRPVRHRRGPPEPVAGRPPGAGRAWVLRRGQPSCWSPRTAPASRPNILGVGFRLAPARRAC